MPDPLRCAESSPSVRGRVRRHTFVPGGRSHYDRARRIWMPAGFTPATAWRHNLVLRDWGYALAKLAAGETAYRLKTLYIEFANLTDPDDAIDAPVFDREHEEGQSYYQALAHSSDRDYLRADVVSPQVRSTDAALYQLGNQLILYGVATAAIGEHGKPFGVAYNSKAYGGALVASPVAGDPTQDVVVARAYFDAEAQQLALATSQIGLEWEWVFG